MESVLNPIANHIFIVQYMPLHCEVDWPEPVIRRNPAVTRIQEGAKMKGKRMDKGRGLLGYLGRSGSAALST